MADNNNDPKGISLRVQKKFLSKLNSKKTVQHFIDDTSSRLLDNLNRAGKSFYDKKVAEKALKNLIKIVIKIAVLYRHDQFNQEEKKEAEKFKQKFRTVGKTIVTFHQVAFTYDKSYLKVLLDECHAIIKLLIVRHLTPKSIDRVDNFFSIYGNPDFMDALLLPDGKCREHTGKIVTDLDKLLEDGVL